MNLVIDIGNTLTKIAVFNGNEVFSFSSYEKLSVDELQALFLKNTAVDNAILSSVIDRDTKIIDFLKSKYRFVELDYRTKIPLHNFYQSPQTLGNDRLACVVGANSIFPNQNILSIDAGTCIKCDFVTNKNQYMGGSISPGIDMRFQALHHFTGKLPLIHYQPFDKLTGENTEESILSGVMNGVAEEVKGIVARYIQQYPDIKVVFTGGYLKFFEKIFNIPSNGKSNIFADSFLVLKGLNQILNYDIQF